MRQQWFPRLSLDLGVDIELEVDSMKNCVT